MRCTFNLKNPKKDGETLIYLKAYFKDEGKKLVYSTGEIIRPEEWDFENRQPNNLTGRTEQARRHKKIKTQIDRYSNHFTLITDLYFNTGQEITIAGIKAELDKEFKKIRNSNTFFDTYDEFMSQKIKNQDWSKSTIKRYDNIKNLLLDFEEKKRYNLNFNSINEKFHTEFTDFCMRERGHINNTYNRNLGLFKTFMYWCLENNKTYNFRFKKFDKKKKVITNQIALEMADLQKLMDHDFKSARLERVRDVFVFACVTGMRFGELKLISKNNISRNFIELKEEKDVEKVSRKIPLNDIANYILKKYDYKLPLVANQKHNDYIKEVFKKAGYTHNVEKNSTKGKENVIEVMPFYDRISSHTARRTFITMMKDMGHSDKLISKITGHRDMKTLNQYYQVNSKKVELAVRNTFNINIGLRKVD